eukprot:SAG22_NODE_15947_length_336_cov_0.856540_1_plen_91_part_10
MPAWGGAGLDKCCLFIWFVVMRIWLEASGECPLFALFGEGGMHADCARRDETGPLGGSDRPHLVFRAFGRPLEMAKGLSQSLQPLAAVVVR